MDGESLRHQQVQDRLRALIAQGYSLRACALKLNVSKSSLHRQLQPGEISQLRTRRIRNERRTEKERGTVQRHIEAAKLTQTKIAQICGVHKSTVSRQTQQMIEGSPELTFKTKRVARAKHCPIHGRVVVWPCVACAALQGKPQP